MFIPFGKVYALSCVEPRGDQVLQAVDNTDNPFWFGKATLKSYGKDFNVFSDDKYAKFETLETYLSRDVKEAIKSFKVRVPHVQQSWGPWGNIVPEPMKNGTVGNYFFTKRDGVWEYAGPGACTHFSEQEWDQLKAGFYNNKINIKVKDE